MLQHDHRHREGRVGIRDKCVIGHRNNDMKYAAQVPGLAWAKFQRWCATFFSWVALKAHAADLDSQNA